MKDRAALILRFSYTPRCTNQPTSKLANMHAHQRPQGLQRGRTTSILDLPQRHRLPTSGRQPESRILSNAPSVEAKRLVPLPKEDLVNYLKSGCKSRANWRCINSVSLMIRVGAAVFDSNLLMAHYHLRIGTEHEKLGFNLGDNSRMSYAQIEAILRKLESRWANHTVAGCMGIRPPTMATCPF